MSTKNSSMSGGVGFSGLLAILLIGLKLGHVIDWPWWLVLAPLWAPVALAMVIVGVGLLVIGVAALLGK